GCPSGRWTVTIHPSLSRGRTPARRASAAAAAAAWAQVPVVHPLRRPFLFFSIRLTLSFSIFSLLHRHLQCQVHQVPEGGPGCREGPHACPLRLPCRHLPDAQGSHL